MPILDIEIVLRPGEQLVPDLARRLALAAGTVLGSAPGETWVRLRGLPADQYAENDGGQALEVFPVFVSVLRADPAAPQTADEPALLAEAVAARCGRPIENTHILYEPGARGRIAFGGRLMT